MATTTARVAGSKTVTDKAQALATAYRGGGVFDVASGSRVGMAHQVRAPFGSDPANPVDWTCTCEWAQAGGTMCSHVRAAAGWVARERTRKARAVRRAMARAVA